MLRLLLTRAHDLIQRALDENATPLGIALSLGVGVFVSCTPLLGFHLWIALGLAIVFRLNKVWAALGSRFSFLVILPFILWAEIEAAEWLRTGQTVHLQARDALTHASAWALDLAIGLVPVGGGIAVVVGSTAYVLARQRELRRTRAPSPPRSSGSRPSGSPAPLP